MTSFDKEFGEIIRRNRAWLISMAGLDAGLTDYSLRNDLIRLIDLSDLMNPAAPEVSPESLDLPIVAGMLVIAPEDKVLGIGKVLVVAGDHAEVAYFGFWPPVVQKLAALRVVQYAGGTQGPGIPEVPIKEPSLPVVSAGLLIDIVRDLEGKEWGVDLADEIIARMHKAGHPVLMVNLDFPHPCAVITLKEIDPATKDSWRVFLPVTLNPPVAPLPKE
jgi:hypothetical protein